MPMEQHMLQTNRKLCPFLDEPFDDCYCSKMSSQDIERAVYLCSKNYEICDIYRNGNGSAHNPRKARGSGNGSAADKW